MANLYRVEFGKPEGEGAYLFYTSESLKTDYYVVANTISEAIIKAGRERESEAMGNVSITEDGSLMIQSHNYRFWVKRVTLIADNVTI